jgi:DNA-binding response OmpR family regulator
MDTRILVIEESLDLCRLFEYILRADGHSVTSFQDWQSAQAALASFAPDVVIFDWSLTNTGGYNWVAELRQHPDTSSIPILFVCGDPPSHKTLELVGELGIAVIEKPFDIFVFRNRLSALLGMRERALGTS